MTVYNYDYAVAVRCGKLCICLMPGYMYTADLRHLELSRVL